MGTTNFVDKTTVIEADWLNDVDAGIYHASSGITGASDRTLLSKLSDIVSVKDFGAVGDGVTDDTIAIVSANAAAIAAGKSLYFPAGTYLYSPSALLEIETVWAGESVINTTVLCRTASYTGEFFRLSATGATVRRMQFKTDGITRLGKGLVLANTNTDNFQAFLRVGPQVWVNGFERNIELNNIYSCVFDQVRSIGGAEGLYGAPIDAAGDNGYFNDLSFSGCYFGDNTRNIYLFPPLVSRNVRFANCVAENATGASEQVFFRNIRGLTLNSFYAEGADTIPAIKLNSCFTSIDTLFMGACGSLSLDNTANDVTMRRVYTDGANAVFDSGATVGVAQDVMMDACDWPSTGNVLNSKTITLVNSTVNGRFHKHTRANNELVADGAINLTSGAPVTIMTFVAPTNASGAIVVPYQIQTLDAGSATQQTEVGMLSISVQRAASGTPAVSVTKFGDAQAKGASTLTTVFGGSGAADGTVTVTCTGTTSVSLGAFRLRLGDQVRFGQIAGA